jgi:ATP-dependent exoDNAse (exonuclease V) alpha subunit
LAILLFQTTSLSRSEGRSATSSAAYRAGEKLRDEARGTVYDHSQRQDIHYKEIILPSSMVGRAPDWVSNRNELWNAAERAETRVNSRVGREYLIGLPHELNAAARLDLARQFATDIAQRYGTIVDLAVHAPRPAGDPRNFHAHLLTTTREITPGGFGVKAASELSDSVRRTQGLLVSRDELKLLRTHWADRANALGSKNPERAGDRSGATATHTHGRHSDGAAGHRYRLYEGSEGKPSLGPR